jgi:hypothetical protein
MTSAQPGPSLGWSQAQPGGAQASHQFAAADLGRSGGDDTSPMLLGNVVMVPLERAARNPQAGGEVVQLGERGVAHQVAPASAAPPPERFVDEHGHRSSLIHCLG